MLLRDPSARGAFRRDPAAMCPRTRSRRRRRRARRPRRGAQTLDVRESRSSVAGVLIAAAAEGMAFFAFVDNAHADGGGGGDSRPTSRTSSRSRDRTWPSSRPIPGRRCRARSVAWQPPTCADRTERRRPPAAEPPPAEARRRQAAAPAARAGPEHRPRRRGGRGRGCPHAVATAGAARPAARHAPLADRLGVAGAERPPAPVRARRRS